MINQEQCKNLSPGEILYYDGKDRDAYAPAGDVSFKRVWVFHEDGHIEHAVVDLLCTVDEHTFFNAEQIVNIANLYIKGTE